MQMRARFGLLMNCPSHRPEAVCEHYLKLAQIALEMRKLLDMKRKDPGLREQVDSLLDNHMEVITRCHREDLGIELAWIEPGPLPRF